MAVPRLAAARGRPPNRGRRRLSLSLCSQLERVEDAISLSLSLSLSLSCIIECRIIYITSSASRSAARKFETPIARVAFVTSSASSSARQVAPSAAALQFHGQWISVRSA